MEISKSAVLLANEHQGDQKKCYKGFSYTYLLYNRLRKNVSSLKEDFNQNGSHSIS